MIFLEFPKKVLLALRNNWMNIPILHWLSHLPFLFSLVGLGVLLFDLGFDQEPAFQEQLNHFVIILLTFEGLFECARYLVRKKSYPFKIWIFDVALLVSIIITIIAHNNLVLNGFFSSYIWLSILFVWIFSREFSSERIELKRSVLNPAQLFILSFLLIIFLGTIALMFPNSTISGIKPVDAFFTSTSAVCVTGLSVVDTGTFFTPFGQVVLMILIQLGGLGIMTFTSYFSYFFTGESSYENQFIIQEMTNSDRVSDVFGTLKRVLLLTFSIETIGALLIFQSLNSTLIPEFGDRIFFSIFHSVSGFCNAGFSTLSDSFYDINYRFNYPLHLTISSLVIFGGIGFPILFNLLQYLNHKVRSLIFRDNQFNRPWIINLNTRIIFATTFFLIGFGTLSFYLLEYNNTLDEHGTVGKIVTAFFGAVTPRTAGFNTVNNASLHMATLFLIYFLMWVGASPGSTGGGIKTSTFAISVLNAFGLARGKDRIDFLGRQISDSSVRRAYAQIFMSLIAIFGGFALVSILNPEFSGHAILFECISAFSTVGLTLGITAKLGVGSKIVIAALMFIGRVSLLTVFAAFLKQARFHKYMYPSEDISIN